MAAGTGSTAVRCSILKRKTHSHREILTHKLTHRKRFLQSLSATWQPPLECKSLIRRVCLDCHGRSQPTLHSAIEFGHDFQHSALRTPQRKQVCSGVHRPSSNSSSMARSYGNLSLWTRKRKPPISVKGFSICSVQLRDNSQEKLGALDLELSNATASIY